MSNLTRQEKPTEEELSEPDPGTDEGVVEADGEIEAGGYRPNMLREFALASAEEEVAAPDTSHLQDVGTASFEDPAVLLETVHGPDNRTRIENTRDFPFRAIASLLITARDGTQYIGTAWFIAPRTLITAGHCVFINSPSRPGRHGWVKSIQVMPGRNGSELPFQSVTSTEFWSVRGWTERGEENYDYGAIIIPGDLGSRLGSFGYAVLPDAELRARVLNVTGYPGDKPQGTLWHDSKRAAAVSGSKVHYDIDTYGGQSGAPVYMIRDGNRYAVAVHAYGGASTNSGTRISRPVFANFRSWSR
ncbi:MAG: trypsin-like serine peptidase [Allosphingosinicella sp.]